MEEKNKYLKLFITILIIIIFLVAGFFIYKTINKYKEKETSEETEIKTITPVLYKVTKEGSNNEMYLFGSIHMAESKDLKAFPSYVIDAYNKSHYLACEIDETTLNTDMDQAQELALSMMYQDGTQIKDHLKEDIYNKLIDFLTKKESYVNVYEYYKPMFFYSLLSNVMSIDAGLSSEAGIDNYFIAKAKQDGKEVLEVESIKFQTDLLLSFSDSLYELMINETLDNYNESVSDLIDLYKYWKDGNVDKILELDDEEFKEKDSYTKEQKKLIDDYNKKLILDRNNTMTDKAIEYFESDKDVFFMVGSLHIIGEDGIASKLQKKGYTVTLIK